MSKYSNIKKIIKKNFPKSKVKYIKEFAEGYNNVAYDVRIDENDYVIKIIKLKGFEDYALKQNKFRKIAQSKFKDYPIAKIIKSDYTKKIIDKPYLIVEKIEGESMLKSYSKINNRDEVFEEIGELYGKIHSFEMDKFGELDSKFNIIKTYNSWYVENCRKIKKIFEKLENNKLLSKKTLQKNKEFFEKNKSLLKKEVGPRLCHGDASLTNIITKKSGDRFVISGLIDFEFCRSSGVVHDLFSGLRTLDKKMNYKNSLVEGYSKYNKLPKDWEKLVYFYKWISSLNQLTRIAKMSWRNLSEEKAIERKKGLRKDALINLGKVQKYFESVHVN